MLLSITHSCPRLVSIRGQLGPISVYTTKKYVPHDHKGIHSNQGAWERVAQHNFEILHRPWTSYRDIVLDVPVDLPPGEQRGFYIHSTLSNDQAIVYDNHYTYNGAPNDEFVKVLPGMGTQRLERALPHARAQQLPRVGVAHRLAERVFRSTGSRPVLNLGSNTVRFDRFACPPCPP